MAEQDIEVANRFLAAFAVAAKTGERERVYPLVAEDVEWVTPERTLHGVDDIREHLIWGYPPENLDVELEIYEMVDLDDGRVRSAIRQIYLWKQTGAFAHERRRQVTLTIKDGGTAATRCESSGN